MASRWTLSSDCRPDTTRTHPVGSNVYLSACIRAIQLPTLNSRKPMWKAESREKQGQRMKPRRSYFQENSNAGDRVASWKTKSWIVVRLISGSCEWDQNPSCVAPGNRAMKSGQVADDCRSLQLESIGKVGQGTICGGSHQGRTATYWLKMDFPYELLKGAVQTSTDQPFQTILSP